MIKQISIIILIAFILSLGVNLISPNSIPYIGSYRNLHSGGGPIIPPSADENDPPFIAIDVAEMEYSLGQSIFIDARDPYEYLCATIPGAINVPFDYLPEENADLYIDSILSGHNKNDAYIIFCSGEECDLSLHLARNMQVYGYTDLAIFFGGSREWEKYELEIQKGGECVE